ncbi:19111_t:CDS:2 [Funneliformis geosporum]|uniref:18891_t:CDS:1 n=1 Tax=Funneliformis geosporum TaxID=1117311 RepID=A0A9W4SV27_9GLOM|nr:19111_t:CDS:2 [Funneliformis geosporum]CAI2182639.1 18891_t:CDS:2 [Funneliformis geosporum]
MIPNEFEKTRYYEQCIDEQEYIEHLRKEVHENAEKEGVTSPIKDDENSGVYVALKSLNDSSNIHQDFLDEVNPKTLNYMIALKEMKVGSLRSNLLIKKYNPNDKYGNLLHITTSLSALHGCNLFHGDFHSGNLLLQEQNRVFVSDLGLSRSPDHSKNPDAIYGVIPYMAPEVLLGKPYIKASDIYSLGIIMWEFTSGVPAYNDVSHDFHLSIEICQGLRPKIIENTIPEYVEIMKSCWDFDPNKRPSADDLVQRFKILVKRYPYSNNRVPVPENDLNIQNHPSSCYTSRKIEYSARINEIISQELSSKIIINQGGDDDEVVMINDELG